MFGFNRILEGLLVNTSAAAVSDIILLFIGIILAVSFFQAGKGHHSRFLDYAPTLMTSLGILGTFIGIVIGLMNFDTSDPSTIDESIPLMLEGLKTAFITSLAGMSAAIIFKVTDAWYFATRREANGVKENITPEHIHAELVKSNEQLAGLKQSLSGAEEGSLVGQIKLARSELNDANRKAEKERIEFSERLWTEMQQFADLLAKSATEAVIEALRAVIADFNKNLTEQFGDNFKRLDESVKKLVDWQQQYMEQLTQMSEQYAEGVKAIDHTREAVQQIGDTTASIPPSLESLKDVIQVNQHQIQELQRHLDAFIKLRDKATEAVPQIQKKLDEIGDQMLEAANEMKIAMLEGSTEFKESVDQTNISMRSLASTVQIETEKMSTTLQDTASDLQKSGVDMLHRLEDGAKSLQTAMDRSVGEIMRNVEQQVQKSMSAVHNEVTKATTHTGDSINKQLKAMNEARDQELNKVMNEMGKALATITQQFTNDYSKLVAAMNAVVQAASRRNPNS